jgi:hypothetical protein
MQIADGTTVTVKVNGNLVQGVVDGYNTKYQLHYIRLADGSRLLRKVLSTVSAVATTVDQNEGEEALPSVPTTRRFSINTRFDFLERFVKMVACGPSNSLVISGAGGLGKSFTVKKVLKANNLVEGQDYVIIKGYATSKSIYRKLYECSDMLVIFDDCDSVIKEQTSVNILKAALDSEAVRTVTWLAESRGEDSLPNQFEFTGKVMFLTNIDADKVPQPLVSRAQMVDVGMTVDEKIERMHTIVADIRVEIDINVKREVIAFLSTIRHNVKDLNIRSFLKVLDIRVSEPTDWRDIAEYSVSL